MWLKAQKNYSIYELELLALQWAIYKSRMYLVESLFTSVTNHIPLVSIINGKNQDLHTNPCIQRILAKLYGYNFRLLWIASKCQIVADALSRSSIWPAEDKRVILLGLYGQSYQIH